MASELNVHADDIFMWQVYTDADFQLRQTQKSHRRPLSKKTGNTFTINI